MIIRICASLFFVLLFVPFGVGCSVLPQKKKVLQFVCGFAASLSLFEILMLIFHTTGASFRLMVGLWCALCGLVALYGVFREKPKVLRSMTQNKTQNKTHPGRTTTVLLVVVILIVAAVTANTVLNTTYVNWDDQTYCANAVSTWQTDAVNRYASYSGTLKAAFYNKKYVIAGWPIYSSMLAELSGIHPAIVFRTLLPLFEIPAAFGIVYLLLREFFPQHINKALLGVVYYIFFALAVSEKMGGDCSEWWIFVNCWTGKSLSFNIVVPLVLWLLLRLEKEPNHQMQKAYWLTLFFVGTAACNIAATMFLILPIELGIFGFFYLYRTKRWKDFWKFALCAAPAMLCVVVTL